MVNYTPKTVTLMPSQASQPRPGRRGVLFAVGMARLSKTASSTQSIAASDGTPAEEEEPDVEANDQVSA